MNCERKRMKTGRHQNFKLWLFKILCQKNERTSHGQGKKMSETHTGFKKLAYRIKNSQNSVRRKHLILKIEKKIWTNLSPNKTYRWQISTWKKNPTSLASKGLPINTRMQYTSTGMIQNKNKSQTDMNKCWQLEPAFLAGGKSKWYSSFGRQFGNFL